MRLHVPALMSVNQKLRHGSVQQLLSPGFALTGTAVKFTIEKYSGVRLSPDDGSGDIYLFRKAPLGANFSPTAGILVSSRLPAEPVEECDASSAAWLKHVLLPARRQLVGADSLAQRAQKSWHGRFHYVDEDSAASGTVALRRPQLGALHAIHAHWSVSRGVATIVMPTGTGKTETMLATLTSARCPRVLVLVPTDALRRQVAEKFLTLGVLKLDGNAILEASAERPVVGVLTSSPRSAAEVDELFEPSNIVVTTSQLAGRCSDVVQARMALHCTHLFIDEAHHAEAPTWKAFKEHYADKSVLQFTATPFREDDRRIDGKIIYIYPLKRAQDDGYFRPIRFSPVFEFGIKQGDRAIAHRVLAELKADQTGKHVAMARVSSTERADAVFELYNTLGLYSPVMLHSKVKANAREVARKKLLNGDSRIVVCVDMLGEGFDMPELKIAAFHDLRKSLAVTLQLAGRFTRARSDLGDPVFIANTANVDLQDELQKLYTQDPDWNALLPELSEAAIADEVGAQEFMGGFAGQIRGIPLNELRPSASTVIYRTTCANWTPRKFKSGFKAVSKYEQIHRGLNEREHTLVVITAARRDLPWTSIATVQDYAWELFIAYWDPTLALLFIHGSSNSGEFKDLAKALCGEDVSLIIDPVIYRTFHGLNRLVLTNVGLDEHFGRQIRYIGRMGADVGSRLSDSTKQGARKSVLAGLGFENGDRASIGAAKRGRVWSAQRLRIDAFTKWCRHIGAKIVDNSIDPEEVLKGTLVPKEVSERPHVVAIGVDWPTVVLDLVESATSVCWLAGREVQLNDVSIEVVQRAVEMPLGIRVFSETRETILRLEIFKSGNGTDFRFVYESLTTASIRRGSTEDLCDFLTRHPPTVWFADGSSLEGNLRIELTASYAPYDRDKLVEVDWSGIDITKESQKEAKLPGTVQYRVIQLLQHKGIYRLIFDDDGAGEAADIVAIRLDDVVKPRRMDVELYHCKFSLRATPGARVDELYVLCGQAHRSVTWLHNRERRSDLFTHLLKRDAFRSDALRPTRIELGDTQELLRLRELSKRTEVRLSVFVVQPGVSKAVVSDSQLTLLSVAEHYLQETYEIPFSVLCSP
jgi:superfamily II DNA or RNA helicase